MSEYRCHFCGYTGDEEELVRKCERCPMQLHHAGMGVSCCPNCGIELKMKSTVVELLQALGDRVRRRKT